MTRTRTPAADHPAPDLADFSPARPRPRQDGWTGERQVAFVEALAECACVEEACARVGMSVASAYALRRRADATSFRRAWEMALDHAVERLSDAVFARALHGVARPVFYQGAQVGERRYYDERLAMFLLRYRDPVRYGAWLDRAEARRHPEGPAAALALGLNRVAWDAARAEAGAPPLARPGFTTRHHVSEAERAEREAQEADARAAAAERADQARRDAEWARYLAELGEDGVGDDPADGPDQDAGDDAAVGDEGAGNDPAGSDDGDEDGDGGDWHDDDGHDEGGDDEGRDDEGGDDRSVRAAAEGADEEDGRPGLLAATGDVASTSSTSAPADGPVGGRGDPGRHDADAPLARDWPDDPPGIGGGRPQPRIWFGG